MQLINNRYKIEGIYGDYENATVYRASDLWNGNKKLLLKLFLDESQNIDIVQKISSDFLELSSVKHKNIISNHSFNIVSSIDNKLVRKNQFFYTKDFVDGVKLNYFFGKLSLYEILDIIVQLIEVADYLQFRGYVYQYITPDNIYVIKDNNNITVKVADLAEILEKKINNSYNDSHSFYLAPEVRLKQKSVDKSSDIYSIGMIFYSLLTGQQKEYLPNRSDNSYLSINTNQKYKIDALLEKMVNKETNLRTSNSDAIVKEINNIFETNCKLNVKDGRNELNFKTKIVGRDKEIRLIKYIDNQFENRCFNNNLVIVTGEEGIGKTRLLKEIEYGLRIKGRTIYSTNIPDDNTKELGPIIKILKQMINNCDTKLIDKYGSELVKILPDITSIKDVKPSSMLSGNRERLRLYDRICNFIVDTVNNRPTYIVIDNFHNSDFETINLINYIVNNNRGCPLLIVLSCNKDVMPNRKKFNNIIDEWSETEGVEELKLLRFNFEETAEMIKNVLGISFRPINFSTRVINDTLGNPRHIEETLKSLLAVGEIFINDSGCWDSKTKNYTKIHIPANVDEAIKRQLKLLNKELLGVAEYVSIFNTSVSKSIIGKIVNNQFTDIDEKINKLVSMKILEERVEDWGYTYDFYNKQLKTYIYQSIDQEKRTKFHKLAADILEEVYLRQNRGNTDELIYHYNLSNQIEKSIKQAISTAKKMRGLVGNFQLISLWENAYDLMKGRTNIDKVDVLVNLGGLCIIQGMNEKAFDYYREGLIDAQKLNAHKHIVVCNNGMADVFYRRKNIEVSEKYVLEAKKIADKYHDIEGTLECIRILNKINIAKGKYYDAIRDSEQYLSLALGEELYYYVGHFYNHIGISYAFTNQIERTRECFERSIDYFFKSGDFIESTRPINNLGAIYSDYYNDMNKAMEYYLQGLDICQKYHSFESEANFLNNIGELYIRDDQYEKAKDYVEKAETITREIEDESLLFMIQVNLATIYLNLGEYEKCYKYFLVVKNEFEKTFIEEQHISRYHNFLSIFYHKFGMYKESLDHAIMTKDKSKELDKKLILSSESRIALLNYTIEGVSDEKDIDRISLKYRKSNYIGDRRKHLLMFAYIAVQAGDIEYANRLLSEDEEASLMFTNAYIDAFREYVICLIDKDNDGLIELKNKIKGLHFNGLEYYVYLSLGDSHFKRKEYYKSANYYLAGLDLLYRLAKKIPNKHLQVSYIEKYCGKTVKNKINIITAVVKKQGIYNLEEKSFSIDMELEDYFDFTSMIELFNEEIFNLEYRENTNTKIKYIKNIEELISYFTYNYKANLELILDFVVQKTFANRAMIYVYNDHSDELETLVSTTENNFLPEKMQILSELRQESEGLLINRSFKHDNNNLFMLLPDDIKALMCVPILKIRSEHINVQTKDRRKKSKLTLHDDIIGYLYLDTDKLFNRFDTKRLKLIEVLSHLISLNMDNHNLKITSSVDKMTGAYTRKYFDLVFKEIINKAIKEESYFTIIMSDVDKFKNVNDTFGHQKGDEILSKVGKIILDSIRETDIVGRYGGEEFIIILSDSCEKDGKMVAEKIRKKVESTVLVSPEYPLTISMGVSMFPQHGQTIEELIEKADQALYKAKESGRNKSVVWSNDIGNSKNRLDKLAGIVTGNIVQDQRNALAMVEIINLLKEDVSREKKIHRFLGRIIEIIEGEQGILFTVNDKKIDRIYARQRFLDTWIKQPRYNKKIILRTIVDKNGEFLIDWEDIRDIDIITGKPNWQSLIVVPLIYNGMVKGVLQISVPIKEKEFDYNSYNFVNNIGNVIAAMI